MKSDSHGAMSSTKFERPLMSMPGTTAGEALPLADAPEFAGVSAKEWAYGNQPTGG